MDLSVVIPAFNEAERLPKTLAAIEAYLQSQSRSWEVIVVDDGSTDGTAEIAETSRMPIHVIRHSRNLGKGAAVRTGMLAATGTWRYLCDADLSTPIQELDHFFRETSGVDIVIGSRRVKGAQVVKRQIWWKVWLGQLGNLAIQLLVIPGIRDTQCGFKLFNARVAPIFERQRLQRFGYDFEVLYLARTLGFTIREIPVPWINDERSKVRPRDYLRTLWEIIQIHWHRLSGHYTNA